MIKKLVVVLCMLALLGFSFYLVSKTKDADTGERRRRNDVS